MVLFATEPDSAQTKSVQGEAETYIGWTFEYWYNFGTDFLTSEVGKISIHTSCDRATK